MRRRAGWWTRRQRQPRIACENRRDDDLRSDVKVALPPAVATVKDDVDEKAAARVKRQLDFGSQKERFEDSDVMMPLGQERAQLAEKHPQGPTLHIQAAKMGAGLGSTAKKERDLVLGVSIDSGTFDASILADQSIDKSRSRKSITYS